MNFSTDRENCGFFDKSQFQQPKLERCYGVVAPLQDFIVVRLINLQLCQNSIYNCSFNVSLLETLQGSRLLFHNDIQVIYFLLAVTAFVTRASPWRLHSAYWSCCLPSSLRSSLWSSTLANLGEDRQTGKPTPTITQGWLFFQSSGLICGWLRIARSSTLMSYFKALWNQGTRQQIKQERIELRTYFNLV